MFGRLKFYLVFHNLKYISSSKWWITISQFKSLPSSGLVDEVFSVWFQTDFSPLLFKLRFIQRLRRPFRVWKGRILCYSWCNPEQKPRRGPGISPAPLPKGDPDDIPSLLSRSLKRCLPESQDSPTAAHLSRGPVESSPGSNLVQEINKKNGIKALFCFFFINTHSVSGC